LLWLRLSDLTSRCSGDALACKEGADTLSGAWAIILLASRGAGSKEQHGGVASNTIGVVEGIFVGVGRSNGDLRMVGKLGSYTLVLGLETGAVATVVHIKVNEHCLLLADDRAEVAIAQNRCVGGWACTT